MVGYRARPMHLDTRCAGNALSLPQYKPSRDREEAVTTLTGRHSRFQRRVAIRNGLFRFLHHDLGRADVPPEVGRRRKIPRTPVSSGEPGVL